MWARNIESLKPHVRRPAGPSGPRLPAHYLHWCRGQDSNLRSRFRLRFYRPPVLATHPPRQQLQGSRGREQGLCSLSLVPMPPVWSPRGDSNPLTYRLQVGCATIAPLGPGRPSPPPGAPLTGRNKIRPPTRRGDGDCSIEAASSKVNVLVRYIPYAYSISVCVASHSRWRPLAFAGPKPTKPGGVSDGLPRRES